VKSLIANETLNRLIRQFLVHSYLYYRLDESLISDQQYDEVAQKLREGLASNYADANFTFKEHLGSTSGSEASGYSIHHYPAEIISLALHLLYQNRFKNLISFSTFLARYGYRTKTETPYVK
jgi:NAD-dependent DNA ligase